MRSALAFTAILAVPVIAASSFLDTKEGDFTSTKTVALPSLKDRAACQAADGTWRAGGCYFNTSDDVSIYAGSHGYDVTVSTVGTDAHSCRFEGVGVAQDDGTMLASVATAIGACEITIRYAGTDWISVKSAGTCRSLCENDTVSLDILRAKRVDILGP